MVGLRAVPVRLVSASIVRNVATVFFAEVATPLGRGGGAAPTEVVSVAERRPRCRPARRRARRVPLGRDERRVDPVEAAWSSGRCRLLGSVHRDALHLVGHRL